MSVIVSTIWQGDYLIFLQNDKTIGDFQDIFN